VKFADCPREQEVIDAVASGRWPHRCDPELTEHVAACDGCHDLARIFGVLGASWEDARQDAHVPAAGTVWWRAQVRARRDAQRAAARPITVAQVTGAILGIVLAAAALVRIYPWLLSALASPFGELRFAGPGAAALLPGGWLLAVAAAALIGFASIAVYLAVAED
jgi:hypothetical protein